MKYTVHAQGYFDIKRYRWTNRQDKPRYTRQRGSVLKTIIINDGRGLYRLRNSLCYTETMSWVIDRKINTHRLNTWMGVRLNFVTDRQTD